MANRQKEPLILILGVLFFLYEIFEFLIKYDIFPLALVNGVMHVQK